MKFGEILPQEGNPINTALDNYKECLLGDPAGDKEMGYIVVSWQFESGSFFKGGVDKYRNEGLVTEEMRKANEDYRRSLGCLDNGATTTELAFLGHVYKRFRDPKHKAAARKTLEWLLKTQQSSGGWQQWTPARSKGHYSEHATFNDDAITRVLIIMQKAVRKEDPFDSDIFTEDQLNSCQTAISKGIYYILKAQIIMDGKPTVWCAQYGMYDYQPKLACSYELPSKSGRESMLIVAFLMSCPQIPEIARAVKGAIDWYNNPEVYVENTVYVRPTEVDGKSPFITEPGRKMWYRFYELDTNKGFFCNHDGKPTYDYQELVGDRYYGYAWAGSWGEPLLEYAKKVGLID